MLKVNITLYTFKHVFWKIYQFKDKMKIKTKINCRVVDLKRDYGLTMKRVVWNFYVNFCFQNSTAHWTYVLKLASRIRAGLVIAMKREFWWRDCEMSQCLFPSSFCSSAKQHFIDGTKFVHVFATLTRTGINRNKGYLTWMIVRVAVCHSAKTLIYFISTQFLRTNIKTC